MMETTNNSESILTLLKNRENELSLKVSELEALYDELKKVRSAIKALGGNVDGGLEYEADGSWSDRIKFILKTYGKLPVSDIVDKVFQYEPNRKKDKDFDTVRNSIANVCSTLANKGEIKAEKDGFRNLYYL